ncbi:MAG: hypothetical protein SFU56_14630 [Capsulimonadales bacterium]|nr:hypothetical protein [Capsulimonadales bacterium]
MKYRLKSCRPVTWWVVSTLAGFLAGCAAQQGGGGFQRYSPTPTPVPIGTPTPPTGPPLPPF